MFGVTSETALIEFTPSKPEFEGVFEPPVPASRMLPQWYRDQGLYADNCKDVNKSGDMNHTVKACMPVFDSMTAGYIIPLPQDLLVRRDPQSNEVRTSWPSDVLAQISSHTPEQFDRMKVDLDVWDPIALKFINPWLIKTPPGYSCLFTQPMWHALPFQCFPGVVDTDEYNFNAVNFPFLLRKGFSGIIDRGVPMIQVIPFKRVAFKSVVHQSAPTDNSEWERLRTVFAHRYKRFCRQKKEYK